MEVGYGTYSAPTTIFQTFNEFERIRIGKYCSIASNVLVMAGGNHHFDVVSTFPFDRRLAKESTDLLEAKNRAYKTTPDTVLGNDVWVGIKAVIGGGANIGDGCVIGAGAVVFSDIEPYSIVVGNPGRVVRRRFDDCTVERLLKMKWWDWPVEFIQDNLDWFYQPVPKFLSHFEESPPAGV